MFHGEASIHLPHYLVRKRRDDSQLSSTTTEKPLLSTSSTVTPNDGHKSNVASSSKKSKSKQSRHLSKGSKSPTTTTTTTTSTTTTTTEAPKLDKLQTTPPQSRPLNGPPPDEGAPAPAAAAILPVISTKQPTDNDDDDPKESAAPIFTNSYADQDQDGPLGEPYGSSDDSTKFNNQLAYQAPSFTTGPPTQDPTSSNNYQDQNDEPGGSRAELGTSGLGPPSPPPLSPSSSANMGLSDLEQPIVPAANDPATTLTVKSKRLRKRKNKKKGHLSSNSADSSTPLDANDVVVNKKSGKSGRSGKKKKGKKAKRKKSSKKSTKIAVPTPPVVEEIVETKAQYPYGIPQAESVPLSNNVRYISRLNGPRPMRILTLKIPSSSSRIQKSSSAYRHRTPKIVKKTPLMLHFYKIISPSSFNKKLHQSTSNKIDPPPPPPLPPPPPAPASSTVLAPLSDKVTTPPPTSAPPPMKKALTTKGASVRPLSELENIEMDELEKIEQQARVNNFQFKKVTLKLLSDVSAFLSANGNKGADIDWRSTIAHGLGEVLFGLGASKMFDQDVAGLAAASGGVSSPAPAPAPSHDPIKALPNNSRSAISDSNEASGSTKPHRLTSADLEYSSDEDSGSNRASKLDQIVPTTKTTKAPESQPVAPNGNIQVEHNKTTIPVAAKQTTVTDITTTHSPVTTQPPITITKATPQSASVTTAPPVIVMPTVKPATIATPVASNTTTPPPPSPTPPPPPPPTTTTPLTTVAPPPPLAVSQLTTPKPTPTTIAPPITTNKPPATVTIATSLPLISPSGKPVVPQVSPAATSVTATETTIDSSDDSDDPDDESMATSVKQGRKPFRRLSLLNRLKNGQRLVKNRFRNKKQPGARLQRNKKLLAKGAGGLRNRGKKSKILIMKKGAKRGKQRQIGIRRINKKRQRMKDINKNDDDDYPAPSDENSSSDDYPVDNPDVVDPDGEGGGGGNDDDYPSVYDEEVTQTEEAALPDYDQQQPVEYEETVSTVQKQQKKKPKANKNKKKQKRTNNKKKRQGNENTTRKNNKKKQTEQSDSGDGSGRSSPGAFDNDNSYNNYDDLNVNDNTSDIEY